MNQRYASIALAGALVVSGGTIADLGAQSTSAFSCTIGKTTFTGTAAPVLEIGLGTVSRIQPDGNLLWYVKDGSKGEKPITSQPVAGMHQAINDIGPNEPLTVVVNAGARFPDDPSKNLLFTATLQGVTKATLAKLPLTVPVAAPGAAAKTPRARIMVDHGRVYHEGASGQVVIEALDFAARKIRGTFTITTAASMDGKAPAIQLTNGKFEK